MNVIIRMLIALFASVAVIAVDEVKAEIAYTKAQLRTMAHENSKLLPLTVGGWDSVKKCWKPHTSLEGGNDTIAYGHKLTDREVKTGYLAIGNRNVKLSCITDSQAKKLFLQDWHQAENCARSWVGTALPTHVFGVVTEMSYQMGCKRVRTFKRFHGYVTSGNYVKASREMLRSKWARSDAPHRARRLSTIVKHHGMD